MSWYGPVGSVKMEEQLLMAAISPVCDRIVSWFAQARFFFGNHFRGRPLPCRVGFPVKEMLFAPIHTSSPSPLLAVASVWLTMTVPKAPNGQGETSWAKAAFAARIQYARVLALTPLMLKLASLMTFCCGVVVCAEDKLSKLPRRNESRSIFMHNS